MISWTLPINILDFNVYTIRCGQILIFKIIKYQKSLQNWQQSFVVIYLTQFWTVYELMKQLNRVDEFECSIIIESKVILKNRKDYVFK